MKTKKRRSKDQVIATVKKIKEDIAKGMPVGKACNVHKMKHSQYQIYKNKVWPENSKTNQKIHQILIEDFKTRNHPVTIALKEKYLNEASYEIDKMISTLQVKIESLKSAKNILKEL